MSFCSIPASPDNSPRRFNDVQSPYPWFSDALFSNYASYQIRYGLENAGLQAGCQSHSQLLAVLEKFVPKLAAANQRRLYRPPPQPRHNGRHPAPSTGPIVTCPDVQRVRHALGPFETGVIDAVEKILQRAAHIPEVFGSAENHRVSGQAIVGRGL